MEKKKSGSPVKPEESAREEKPLAHKKKNGQKARSDSPKSYGDRLMELSAKLE